MSFRAAIFDLDGTLINSLTDLARSGNELLKLYGRPAYHEEKYKYFVGNGSRKLMERLLPDFTPDQIDEALAIYTKIYARNLYQHTKPYKYILDMLQQLKLRGVLLAVCTNKHASAVNGLISASFPANLFDVIKGVGEGEKPKPSPDNTLKIMASLEVKPEETIFVGDTMVDMQTAKNAGAFPVGVLWGFRTQQELEENGAGIIISDPRELLTAVEF